MSAEQKKIFISYSWTVQDRTIDLAERLMANGIDVVIDVWNLKEGQDKYAFMEQSVNDASVDRVLIICDQTYAEKADNRQGGVGDETVIISPEIYGNVAQTKFIPVVFESDENGKGYMPHYLKSRIYIDLSSDERYEGEYEKLIRSIYEKPLHQKPALGKRPAWLDDEKTDLSAMRDAIKQLKGDSGNNEHKTTLLIHRIVSLIVDTTKSFYVPRNAGRNAFIGAVDQTLNFRNLYVSFCEAVLPINCPTSDVITSLFEKMYNTIWDYSLTPECDENMSQDLRRFILWELFITTTAVLLHYEQYGDLYKILSHTYFLQDSHYTSIEPKHYSMFWKNLETLEALKRETKSNLITMQGEILVNRKHLPILTKESISNADLVLYQLGQIILSDEEDVRHNYWFPIAYVYHDDKPQPIWIRLSSAEYCKKIMPLFDSSSIDELRQKITLSVNDSSFRYSHDVFECAPGIVRWIAPSKIGTLR